MLAKLLMQRRELFVRLGTKSSVHAGFQIEWSNFACFVAEAVWPKEVRKIFINGVLVDINALSGHLQCDVAPELAIMEGMFVAVGHNERVCL